MSVVCIHHSADMDGLFSGAVVQHYRPEAVLIGWDYGDPVPEIPEDVETLYLVDLSIPELMEHPRLVWIDHHKTAIERYPHFIRGVRLDGVAACRLAWQWFDALAGKDLPSLLSSFPTLEDFRERLVVEPYVLTLVGEYDVWDKRDPLAELLNLVLQATPRVRFDWFLEQATREAVEGIAREGLLCRSTLLGHYRRGHSSIETILFEGLRFACLNGRGNSLAFDGADLGDADALMLWHCVGGDRVKVSLYHRPGREELDLSEIAKRKGGGGHRGACGFESWFSDLRIRIVIGRGQYLYRPTELPAQDHGEGEG